MINSFEPKFAEDGKIIPNQKFCASCKKRLDCDLLYEQRKQNNTSNEYSDMLLSMYFTCENHESMYIEFPILVNSITSDLSNNENYNVGKYCIVSINAENYDENLHIGLYIGELPISIVSLYDKKTTEIRNKFNTSPAIFVPKYNKIFYGMNMRWNFINNISDFDLLENEPKEYIEVAKKHLTNSQM